MYIYLKVSHRDTYTTHKLRLEDVCVCADKQGEWRKYRKRGAAIKERKNKTKSGKTAQHRKKLRKRGVRTTLREKESETEREIERNRRKRHRAVF